MCAEWRKLGLVDEVVEGLEGMGLETPANIQNLAIPRILNREDVLFAAETGSGKTLAYLAPIFSMLKAEEAFMSQAQAVAEHRLNNLVEEENVALDFSAAEDEVSQVESIAQSMGRSQDSRVKAAIAAAAQQSSVQVAGEVARLSSLGQQSIHEGHLLLRESHGLRDHWERRYFVLQSSGFLTMLADEKEKNSSFLVSETGIQNHMVCLPGTCLISLCCVDSLT